MPPARDAVPRACVRPGGVHVPGGCERARGAARPRARARGPRGDPPAHQRVHAGDARRALGGRPRLLLRRCELRPRRARLPSRPRGVARVLHPLHAGLRGCGGLGLRRPRRPGDRRRGGSGHGALAPAHARHRPRHRRGLVEHVHARLRVPARARALEVPAQPLRARAPARPLLERLGAQRREPDPRRGEGRAARALRAPARAGRAPAAGALDPLDPRLERADARARADAVALIRPVYEIAGDPGAAGPFVFSCEHATNELPEWDDPDAGDRRFLAEHWGWDIGAADLTRALCRLTGSCAVLARFSRLVCDPNRDPAEPGFLVGAIDGESLALNRGVDAAERRRRRERYFDPSHAAIGRPRRARRRRRREFRLCAIHSFPPVWLGQRRPMEVGVLFDAHDEHAWRLEGALAAEGFEVALNAPYSGKDGLIYSARRHGRAHDLVYVELEVRQDLIDTLAKAENVAVRVARALLY